MNQRVDSRKKNMTLYKAEPLITAIIWLLSHTWPERWRQRPSMPAPVVARQFSLPGDFAEAGGDMIPLARTKRVRERDGARPHPWGVRSRRPSTSWSCAI